MGTVGTLMKITVESEPAFMCRIGGYPILWDIEAKLNQIWKLHESCKEFDFFDLGLQDNDAETLIIIIARILKEKGWKTSIDYGDDKACALVLYVEPKLPKKWWAFWK